MRNKIILLFLLISANLIGQQTYVPDDSFEQALIDLGYDDVLDDYVVTANINTIQSLNVSSKNISDITGIGDFTALTELDCASNQLTNIDVTQNTALITLYCHGNQLAGLDVTQNTALVTLQCEDSMLTSIDVSQNTVLTKLYVSQNQLASIDVSQNTALNTLGCYSNQLTSINVTQNTALTSLYCGFNPLTSLDISQNTALNVLECRCSQLTSLDVSANTALTLLTCDNNQLTSLNVKNGNNNNFTYYKSTSNPNLTCIFVDDAAWSTANWTQVDASSTFVETQTECDVLGIDDETFRQNIELYPNPTSGILHIRNNENITIKKIIILNTLGQKIIDNQVVSNIDISKLPNGIYYVNLENIEGNKASYKIIKE